MRMTTGRAIELALPADLTGRTPRHRRTIIGDMTSLARLYRAMAVRQVAPSPRTAPTAYFALIIMNLYSFLLAHRMRITHEKIPRTPSVFAHFIWLAWQALVLRASPITRVVRTASYRRLQQTRKFYGITCMFETPDRTPRLCSIRQPCAKG